MEAWVYGPEHQEIRERVLAPGKLEEHVKDTFQAGLDSLQELVATAESQASNGSLTSSYDFADNAYRVKYP